MAPQAVDMAPDLTVFAFGQRRLRDQGSDPAVLSFMGERNELLFGDSQVLVQSAKLAADVTQAVFYPVPAHTGSVEGLGSGR